MGVMSTWRMRKLLNACKNVHVQFIAGSKCKKALSRGQNVHKGVLIAHNALYTKIPLKIHATIGTTRSA